MHAITSLVCFSVRQILGVEEGEKVLAAVTRYFTDHSQTLPKALATANDRSWKALGIALAGDSLFDKVKIWLTASGDEKGFREQVGRFLANKDIAFEGQSAEFRSACLNDLNKAIKAKRLSIENLDPKEIATHVDFRRFSDRDALLNGAEAAVVKVADALQPDYRYLAQLLRQPTPGGCPPLLIVAFTHFFRREIETNVELAHGLLYDGQQQLFKNQQEMLAGLEQMSINQATALDEINVTLKTQGEKFDVVFEELVRIIDILVNTHDAVLDIQAELRRFRDMQVASTTEVQKLLQEVAQRLAQANMQVGEVKPRHSFSIRQEDERKAVHALLDRFHHLPEGQRNQLPALLNGLGKLQVGTGEFEAAYQAFQLVTTEVNDKAAKAEAFYNTYLAALEKEQWDKALEAIKQAATLDHQRFSPFPMHQYQPKRILGAGGFGTAVLCLDNKWEGEEVVVKILHANDLERGVEVVFQEAKLLRKLHHPAIIGVRDYGYATPENHRPYIVMDYFPGVSLEQFVKQHGTISPEHLVTIVRQIAEGMKEAHTRGILHRDLKPDNVLVRKEGEKWHVNIIDFGLAVKDETGGTDVSSSAKSIIGQSITGTAKYAPPEQLGELPGIKPGQYSDIYSFGKLCYTALFCIPTPDYSEQNSLPELLRNLLGACTSRKIENRPAHFQEVLDVLNQWVGAESLPTTLSTQATPTQPGETEVKIYPVADQKVVVEETTAQISVQGSGVGDTTELHVQVFPKEVVGPDDDDDTRSGGGIRFPLRKAYSFAHANDLAAEIEPIKLTPIHSEFKAKYNSTVRRGYVIDLLKREGLLDAFINQEWSHGSSQGGRTQCEFCLKVMREYEEFLAQKSKGSA